MVEDFEFKANAPRQKKGITFVQTAINIDRTGQDRLESSQDSFRQVKESQNKTGQGQDKPGQARI